MLSPNKLPRAVFCLQMKLKIANGDIGEAQRDPCSYICDYTTLLLLYHSYICGYTRAFRIYHTLIYVAISEPYGYRTPLYLLIYQSVMVYKSLLYMYVNLKCNLLHHCSYDRTYVICDKFTVYRQKIYLRT